MSRLITLGPPGRSGVTGALGRSPRATQALSFLPAGCADGILLSVLCERRSEKQGSVDYCLEGAVQ